MFKHVALCGLLPVMVEQLKQNLRGAEVHKRGGHEAISWLPQSGIGLNELSGSDWLQKVA